MTVDQKEAGEGGDDVRNEMAVAIDGATMVTNKCLIDCLIDCLIAVYCIVLYCFRFENMMFFYSISAVCEVM